MGLSSQDAAAAISFIFSWPQFFLTSAFTVVFLSLPLPAPTLKQALRNVLHVLAAFALGTVFTLLLLPYPPVYVPALGLVLFQLYYLANRGWPNVADSRLAYRRAGQTFCSHTATCRA